MVSFFSWDEKSDGHGDVSVANHSPALGSDLIDGWAISQTTLEEVFLSLQT
jgi:hypothetical protein